MLKDNPRILIVSSGALSMGPGVLAGQYYRALQNRGAEVDLLLKYPEEDFPDILSVYDKKPSRNLLARVLRKIKRMIVGGDYPIGEPYRFFYKREDNPPVPSEKVIRKITKEYDLVCVLFWQGMLSFETISKMYDKLQCQFQFLAVDYSPMSGGCHFIGDCQRYQTGCGACPAIHSKDVDDFTSWNVKYRKKVYDKVRPIIYGNPYMQEFYKKSFLLKNLRLATSKGAIIDTDMFKPLDQSPLNSKYNIPDEKKIRILVACQDLEDKRKGIKYLIEALSLLWERLLEKRKEMVVLIAGKGYDKVKTMIPFDTIGLGYVPMNELPEIYSMSSFYVCSSVDDAGPMMVGQSLCCATPVVGFDMGAVKLLVKNKQTGVCVPLRDSIALANGMESVINMPKEAYLKMSAHCREVAMQHCSFTAQAEMILETYYRHSANNNTENIRQC